MPTDNQISQFCQHLSLSEKALTFIKSILSLELPLRARSARGNVSGCYPSHKMTSSMQFESRMIELPFIYQIEHDDKVLELFDQPSSH
jgi:putative transposase